MTDINKDGVVTYTDEGSQDGSGVQHRFGGRDRIFIPTQEQTSKSGPTEDDSTADESVFSNAKAYDIYKPIEKYEGRHRFDLNATWSDDEEKKLVRRVSISRAIFICRDWLLSFVTSSTFEFVYGLA
ncbi:MAG: hypothetical protein LQ342_008132 [Letrouitia transgressa]|nr:MAG: hypothetical protein LQ342_008132 [Letrouitia transgressa]